MMLTYKSRPSTDDYSKTLIYVDILKGKNVSSEIPSDHMTSIPDPSKYFENLLHQEFPTVCCFIFIRQRYVAKLSYYMKIIARKSLKYLLIFFLIKKKTLQIIAK